jgi:hypothetical protein
MPFHINQIEIVLENINKWNIFKPCTRKSTTNRVEIIFFIGYLNEANLNSNIHKLPNKLDCFSHVSIILHKYKSIIEDKHVIGSRLMFESMLLNFNKNASFIFYMEPDTRPVKSNWLNAILNEIGHGNFWCKGSIFRGNKNKLFSPYSTNPYIPALVHINGNAIYNIGNVEFVSFYFNTLRSYIVKKNGDSKNAYDTDFFEYLIDKNNYEITRNILHQFHFTDLIQNYWHTEYNVSEIALKHKFTYFVHGGKPIYAK